MRCRPYKHTNLQLWCSVKNVEWSVSELWSIHSIGTKVISESPASFLICYQSVCSEKPFNIGALWSFNVFFFFIVFWFICWLFELYKLILQTWEAETACVEQQNSWSEVHHLQTLIFFSGEDQNRTKRSVNIGLHLNLRALNFHFTTWTMKRPFLIFIVGRTTLLF